MTIVKKTSPNFSDRGGFGPEIVVIHISAGTLASMDSWFASRASVVSAHYSVGLKGEVHQYVDESKAAWTQGRVKNPTAILHPNINPNLYSLSVEHEGQDLAKGTEIQLRTSVELVRDICTRYKIPIDKEHIVFHSEIFSDKPNCPTPDKTFKDKYLARLKAGDLSPAAVASAGLDVIKEEKKRQIIKLINEL